MPISQGATYASSTCELAMIAREVVPHLTAIESVVFTAAVVGARGVDARSKESACLAYVAPQELS